MRGLHCTTGLGARPMPRRYHHRQDAGGAADGALTRRPGAAFLPLLGNPCPPTGMLWRRKLQGQRHEASSGAASTAAQNYFLKPSLSSSGEKRNKPKGKILLTTGNTLPLSHARCLLGLPQSVLVTGIKRRTRSNN